MNLHGLELNKNDFTKIVTSVSNQGMLLCSETSDSKEVLA